MARTTRKAPSSRAPRGPSSRVTRSKKTHIDDTANVEQELSAQLRRMGLYAADTIGDGNCLFRALSDQLYGTPNWHGRLRAQICDYLAAHPEQFAGFVDGSYDSYVANMRDNGTYGGHVELSAFAQLSLKQIKVVQPNLVLVVTGTEEDEASQRARSQKELERSLALDKAGAEGILPVHAPVSRAAGDRERRRIRRASQKGTSSPASSTPATTASSSPSNPSTAPPTPASTSVSAYAEPLETVGPLYIAYHNWEHYSSVRSLDGPHTGLPRIQIKDPGPNLLSSAAESSMANEDEDEPLEPTEEESRVLRCLARPHPIRQIRTLLAQHDFNSVVELLTEHDARVDENEDSSSPRSGSVSTPATVQEDGEELTPPSTQISNKRLPTYDLDGRENKRRSHSPLTSPPLPESVASSRPSSALSRTETPESIPTKPATRRSARIQASRAASDGPATQPAPKPISARERKQMRAVEKALNRKAAVSDVAPPSQARPPSPLDGTGGPSAVDGFRELKI